MIVKKAVKMVYKTLNAWNKATNTIYAVKSKKVLRAYVSNPTNFQDNFYIQVT